MAGGLAINLLALYSAYVTRKTPFKLMKKLCGRKRDVELPEI
jgi:hypothetical protein